MSDRPVIRLEGSRGPSWWKFVLAGVVGVVVITNLLRSVHSLVALSYPIFIGGALLWMWSRARRLGPAPESVTIEVGDEGIAVIEAGGERTFVPRERIEEVTVERPLGPSNAGRILIHDFAGNVVVDRVALLPRWDPFRQACLDLGYRWRDPDLGGH